MKTIISLIFFIGLTSAAFPSESELVQNNLAHEYSSCSTYYLLMAELPGLLEEIKEKYDSTGFFLFNRAADLTSPELTYAMVEHEKTKIKKISKGSWDNLFALHKEYAHRCKALVEKPEERLQYWRDKEVN